jgi:hypothetical protein
MGKKTGGQNIGHQMVTVGISGNKIGILESTLDSQSCLN